MDNRIFVLFGILLTQRYSIDQLDTVDDRVVENLVRFCWRTSRFFDTFEREEIRRDERQTRQPRVA